MAAPRHISGIGTPEKHTACIDCGIRLVTRHYYRNNMPAAEKAGHGAQFGVHGGNGRCLRCNKRHHRGSTVTNTPPGARIPCPHCSRPTVSDREWRAADDQERAELRAHGWGRRVARDGTCIGCYGARREGRESAGARRPAPTPAPIEDIAYEGEWVRRGLILVPTEPKRGAA